LAISKEKKKELVASYAEKFGRSKAILAADYRGLSVAQIGKLRNELRGQACEFLVAKNTLARLALEEAKLPALDGLSEGPTAVGICYEDAAAPAKTLADLAADLDEIFQLKGGLLRGKAISAADIVALSKLPSREVLLAQLLGNMQAPVGGLARTLQGVIQGFANVVNARKDQLEQGEAA